MSVNLKGKTIGELLVIDKVGFSFGAPYWECLCSCGRTCAVSEKKLLHGTQTTCGVCAGKEKRQPIDLIGERFGELVVNREISSRNKQRRWLCKCDCGQVIIVYQSQLRNGRKTSCGHDTGNGHKKDYANMELTILKKSKTTTQACLAVTLLEPTIEHLAEEEIEVYNKQCVKKAPLKLKGKQLGKLLVVRKEDSLFESEPVWYCICACGRGCYFTERELFEEGIRECGECNPGEKRDFIGRRFGESVIIAKGRFDEETNRQYWKARCDCGNEFDIAGTSLYLLPRIYCGGNHSRYLDKNLIGQTFGTYKVTKPTEGNYRAPHWNIQCSVCGVEAKAITRKRLSEGKVNICGCNNPLKK